MVSRARAMRGFADVVEAAAAGREARRGVTVSPEDAAKAEATTTTAHDDDGGETNAAGDHTAAKSRHAARTSRWGRRIDESAGGDGGGLQAQETRDE